MRRVGMYVIAVLLLLLAVASVSDASVKIARCPPRGLHVVASNREAAVYSIRRGEVQYYRGCLRGKKRSFFLGELSECASSDGGCEGIEHITLAGAVVADERAFGSPFRDEWVVEVHDLRTGRLLYEVPTGSPLKPRPEYVGVGEVITLVAKSDGAVAWIARDTERSPEQGTGVGARYYDLGIYDRSGYRQLAAGVNVHPRSLTLTGHTIHWIQGDKRMSAPLR
jgi:hypothetical protein